MRGFSAIVDLAGRLSMTSCGSVPLHCGEGFIQILADIRLDNRQELLGRLVQDGIALPADPGDRDLLLGAYLRWGADCPVHLIGDFSFVIWDARLRRLLAACDPLGVKPLHYARRSSLLCCASEAQQVLRRSAIPVAVDEIAVGDFLIDNTFEPQRSFFCGVLRLPPGHRLLASSDSESIDRFWNLDLNARTFYSKDDDYSDHFLDLFSRAVRDRLKAPASPVGVLMSGGLDSCSVAAVATRSLPADGSLRLFTTSFVFEQLQECDERPFIEATTAELGLEGFQITAERFPVLGTPDSRSPALEGPFLPWDGCFREALRQARNRGAHVLLTGHGGDDLLAGSVLSNRDRLRRGDARVVLEVARHALAQSWAWRWIVYHDLVQPLLPQRIDRALRRGRTSRPGLPDWIDSEFARRTGLSGRLEPQSALRGADQARRTLRDRFLRAPWDRVASWYDQHAADFGIEVRHPFLDRRLIEFLVSIPSSQLFRTGTTKPLLRRAMRGLLPDAVRLRRGKTQLGAFVDLAMADRWEAQVEQRLESPWLEKLGFVDGPRLRSAYRRVREGRQKESDACLWSTLSCEFWLNEHRTALGIELPSRASRTAA